MRTVWTINREVLKIITKGIRGKVLKKAFNFFFKKGILKKCFLEKALQRPETQRRSSAPLWHGGPRCGQGAARGLPGAAAAASTASRGHPLLHRRLRLLLPLPLCPPQSSSPQPSGSWARPTHPDYPPHPPALLPVLMGCAETPLFGISTSTDLITSTLLPLTRGWWFAGSGVRLDDPCRSLPTQDILWFCEKQSWSLPMQQSLKTKIPKGSYTSYHPCSLTSHPIITHALHPKMLE